MKYTQVISLALYASMLVHIGISFVKQELVTMNYISKYSDIAVSEMHRTGVPASIKLGQAILESNAGQSELATVANNHFGIKCGSKWTGHSMYLEDDDYDEEGYLKESCFRVFRDVESSFIAHSNFLYHPDERSRYDFLFSFKSDDYHSWAFGLRKAGYATDKKYADKLIDIIDKYQLYEYDQKENKLRLNVNESVADSEAQDTVIDVTAMFAKALKKREESGYIELHTPPSKKENKEALGNKTTKSANFTESDIEKKIAKNRMLAKKGEHVVLPGESMRKIARRHGLSLHKLCAYNRIPEGSYPLPGEILKVDGYVHWGKRPKTQRPTSVEKDEILFTEEQ